MISKILPLSATSHLCNIEMRGNGMPYKYRTKNAFVVVFLEISILQW